MKKWVEQKVRRYEHMRWAQEPNRRMLPFSWGLEHIGGSANEGDPRGFLKNFVEEKIARSDEWFAVTPAEDYQLKENVLMFTSAIASPWAENNRVHGQFFPTARKGAAVVVLAQWNARWEEQQAICQWLNKKGLTAIKMSLPYHDRRSVPGHPRADHLVGPNIGLTMQANRQAVLDVRRTLLWLEREGFTSLGILGHQHRIVHRVHHHVPRATVASRRVFARLDTFWRCGGEWADDDECVGVDEGGAETRRGELLLVADQSAAVCAKAARRGEKDSGDQRAVRSDVLARVYGIVFGDDEAE